MKAKLPLLYEARTMCVTFSSSRGNWYGKGSEVPLMTVTIRLYSPRSLVLNWSDCRTRKIMVCFTRSTNHSLVKPHWWYKYSEYNNWERLNNCEIQCIHKNQTHMYNSWQYVSYTVSADEWSLIRKNKPMTQQPMHWLSPIETVSKRVTNQWYKQSSENYDKLYAPCTSIC